MNARDIICKAINDGHDVDGIILALVSAGYRITTSTQHEALMAAAKANQAIENAWDGTDGSYLPDWRDRIALQIRDVKDANAALRVAGLDTGKSK